MMRRLTLAVALLTLGFAATPARAVDFNILVGYDFPGDFEADTVSLDANSGYHAGLELMWDLGKRFELGVGADYGFPRDSDDATGDSDTDYWTVAGVGRFYLVGENIRWYLMGRLGYVDISSDDDTSGDLSGKEMYSAGTGLQLGERIKLEAVFNSFNADLETVGQTVDFEYTNYSLRFIFTF